MASREDFSRARIAAEAAAATAFAAAQRAYPDDMEGFRLHLAEFRRAKDTVKETSSRELAAVLGDSALVADANDRLRTATEQLETEISRQQADEQSAQQIGLALNVLLSAVLLFGI